MSKRRRIAMTLAASCAALVASATLCAQGIPVPAGPPTAAEAELLRPVAPELRTAGRQAMAVTRMLGSIDEKVVLASRGRPGQPAPPRLADVPVVEQMVPVPGAPAVKVYVINAKAGTSRPGILHTHGGGFVIGTPLTDIPRLQALAKTLDCVIVTVDYRLAPETTYKGSTEDNYAGLRWMHGNAQALGLDRGRIAVMGESAGGGHAALLAITARDRGEIPIAFQLLVYPMLDDRTGGAVKPSAHIATVGWSASENQYGWRAFLGQTPGGRDVPTAAVPARTASLAGLPPAFIEVGGVDLFASEDIDYARRLNEAGVPTELLVIPGAFHGFDQLAPDAPQSRQFNEARVEALRRAFARTAH